MTEFNKDEWHEISTDDAKNRQLIKNYIAKTFIRQHGEFAVMRAMEEMLSENAEHKLLVTHWRGIVEEIERLQNDTKEP